jgi:hypothetical protein
MSPGMIQAVRPAYPKRRRAVGDELRHEQGCAATSASSGRGQAIPLRLAEMRLRQASRT